MAFINNQLYQTWITFHEPLVNLYQPCFTIFNHYEATMKPLFPLLKHYYIRPLSTINPYILNLYQWFNTMKTMFYQKNDHYQPSIDHSQPCFTNKWYNIININMTIIKMNHRNWFFILTTIINHVFTIKWPLSTPSILTPMFFHGSPRLKILTTTPWPPTRMAPGRHGKIQVGHASCGHPNRRVRSQW